MTYPRSQGPTGEQLAKDLAPPDTLRLIITGNTTEAIEALTTTAEKIGKALARSVTTSQIRNIFGTVRTIEQDTKKLDEAAPLPISVQRALMMLRPKLAYQYGRASGESKEPMGSLTHILSEAISLVGSSVLYFRNFMDFFEAILAYHRRYGGRTN